MTRQFSDHSPRTFQVLWAYSDIRCGKFLSERCIFSLGREIIVQNNEKERYGVDMKKKVLILGTVMTLAAGCLVGCGTNNNSVTDQSTASPSVEDDRNLNTKDPQYSPDGDDGVVDDLEDGVDDAVDGAEDAVDDVIDGTEDAVDDAADALDGDDDTNDTNNNNGNKKNNKTTNNKKNHTKNTNKR